MIGILLGVVTIVLGAKAFSPAGLPLTRSKNITGRTAKIVGVICIVLGALFILEGTFGTMRLVQLLTGSPE